MPKELSIDPLVMRKRGEITFAPVPVHAYGRSLAEERERRGDRVLIDVLRHMLIVREFETMLGEFKSRGAYGGIEYAYRGPAHLSVGQEGAAVGAALALRPEDHIFGSHRSHGEFIAKGLSAIEHLDKAALQRIMAEHQGGRVLKAVERHIRPSDDRSLAEAFL